MGSPLIYLIGTKLKNQVKSFFKSPGKIIYLVILAALIVITIFSGNKADTGGRTFRDIRELAAGVTVFYSVKAVLISYNGFSNGASMYTMADVNFLFPGPFQQRKVLFYGLFRQLGTSLLPGFFILFQYAWLHRALNIGYGVVLIILLGYAFTVFFAQIAAMVIYSLTSADDRKKSVAKTIYFLVIAAFAAYIAAAALGDRTRILERVAAAAVGPVAGLFPIAGWIGRVVEGILLGNAGEVLFGLILCAVFLAALICFLVFGKHDFYEDVLKSSEIAQSAITARKEGQIGDAAPSRVRVGRIGIGRGVGAGVFYYKHMLENRRSRLLILEPMSLTFAVILIVIAVFMRKSGLLAILPTATIFQFFTVALGRFNKELTRPYIYLIPEPPLKKMLYALAELLPSTVLEALIIFIPVSIIMGASPAAAALCIAVRISYAFLLTAVNVAVSRLWGGSNKTLAFLLYFAVLAAMAAPGIVLAAVAGTLYGGAPEAVFVSLVIANVPVALLVLFLCRNMLQYAELNRT